MSTLTKLSLLLLLAAPATALAQPEGTDTSTSAPLPTAADGSVLRRPVPDYQGRPPRGPTLVESLAWGPRVVFFPVYVVTEFGIRRPLGWLLTEAERGDWANLFIDLFTFDERRVGLIPIALIDVGFRPSVGFHAFYNEAFFPGNSIKSTLTWGGEDWIRASISDHVKVGKRWEVGLDFNYVKRSDFLFFGLGPDSNNDNRTRYLRRAERADLSMAYRFWRGSRLNLGMGISSHRFDATKVAFDSDVSLADGITRGFFPAPPGLDGYVALSHSAELVLDTREARPADGTGIRLQGRVLRGLDPRTGQNREWLDVRGSAGLFWEFAPGRTLGLLGNLAETFRLSQSDPVPFTELPQAGQHPLLLGGFLPGRLIAPSMAVLTLEYRYSVWVWLDGEIHYSVGNVFGENFGDASWGKLRQSFGLGLRSSQNRDGSINLLVAFGTKTFDEGGGVDSFRLLIGASPDF